MQPLIKWLEAFFTGMPMPLLEVWGRMAYTLGLVLAIAAFGRFTFRPGGSWGLGREKQNWDPQAFFSMGLTFVLVPVAGFVGSDVVLVEGAQTLESLKDVVVFLTIVLFGYPALVAIPPAYMLSDLIEGVPPGFVLDWAPGYFFWTAFVWIAYQLIGKNPDFRQLRTWLRYGAFVVALMAFDPVMWGYICSDKFTPQVSYAAIAPALSGTLLITWLVAPFATLLAYPLVRRVGLYWAELPGHVRERRLGEKRWIWDSGIGNAGAAAELRALGEARGAPIRMVLAATFMSLVLILVGMVSFLALRSGEEAANQLAARLHQEIAENINLRLDSYMENSQYRNDPERVADIAQLLARLTIAKQGRALLVDTSGRVVASSRPSTGEPDIVVREAIGHLTSRVGDLIRLDAPVQFRYDAVIPKPLSRETWLAQATRYTDNAGRVDWIVITAMPESYYLASVREGGSRTAKLSAVALTLALVLAGVLAAVVAAPIRRIAQSVEAMAKGDLSQRVENSHLQELDALVRAFNSMAEQLQAFFDRTASSQQTLKAVFNASPVAMAVLDSSDFQPTEPDLVRGMPVVDVNDAWHRVTGHAPEAITGHSSTQLNMWNDFADRLRFTALMAQDGQVDNFEAELRRADGRLYTGSLSMRQADVGTGRMYILAIEDITERRQASARLLDLNQQLHTLFDAAVEVSIIATDPEGRITVFNRGAERMLGYAAADVLGRPVLGFFDIGEVLAVGQAISGSGASRGAAGIGVGVAVFASLTHGGASDVRNWTYICKDGSSLQVSMALNAVHDAQGEVTGYLLLARDITAQLAAESDLRKLNQQLDQRVRDRTQALQATAEQLQSTLDNLHQTQDKLVQSEKLASLGAIVTAVAHELNTPIGICVTVASTMQEKTDVVAQHVSGGTLRRSQLDDYVGNLRSGMQLLLRALDRARDLVSNFKRVAVDQGGGQRRVSFNLLKAINDMAELARITLRKTPYTLELDVPEDLTMDSFPGAIEQVFSNLVSNSVAHGFADRSHGLMRVSAAQRGDTVVLVYTDDGHGMSADTQRRIFDPFFTTALGKGGSGLGMAISYNLVTGPLGGSIELHSEPGKGSRFTITLPCTAPTLSATVVTATSVDQLGEAQARG